MRSYITERQLRRELEAEIVGSENMVAGLGMLESTVDAFLADLDAFGEELAELGRMIEA